MAQLFAPGTVPAHEISHCRPAYGSLGAWRAALFAALGLGVANGCARGDETLLHGEGEVALDSTTPVTDAGSTPAPSGPLALCAQAASFPTIAGTSRDTGYFACEGGWYHRAERKECPSIVPRSGVLTGHDGKTCEDSSCTERPNGFCNYVWAAVGVPGGYSPMGSVECSYGCVSDDECSAGQVCFCDDPVGRCVPAACQSDSDCPGSLCVGTATPEGCIGSALDRVYFACARAEDECLSGRDCGQSEGCEQGSEAESRRCVNQGVCGRPFLVDGVARLAGSEANASWLARRVSPGATQLGTDARAVLARHWTQIARMEHASVAAFARFILELLAAGAPAELVSGAQSALGDEIEHARLCFDLASVYAGAAIGPSSLELRGVLAESGLHATVSAAIHEACIGETLAAAEACEALAEASDPAVRQVLTKIVRDESAHAELGWKFLQWALASGGPELRALARREVQRAIDSIREQAAACSRLAADPLTATLAGHGLCTEQRRHAARRAALEQVVVPLSRALLGEEASRSGAAHGMTGRDAARVSARVGSSLPLG